MKDKHIVFLSPPFYSHFMPMLALAKSFKSAGLTVTIACSKEFAEEILAAEIGFHEMNISNNKNTGTAAVTEQPDSEKERLAEFFAATRNGAIATLLTQMQHRKADMLANPEKIMHGLQRIEELLQPDLWIVDILSYSVSLSLYCLQLKFVTFCPPHPNTIPSATDYYGIPPSWPTSAEVKKEALTELQRASLTTEKEFTAIFNKFIIDSKSGMPLVDNAFRLVSPQAIIYNYFDFNQEESQLTKSQKIFLGHAFTAEKLEAFWLDLVAPSSQRKILISLGTFLSERKDVLERLIKGCQTYDEAALLIVSAGSKTNELESLENVNTIIKAFIPQKELIGYMDVVIHHGGCNSFTESVYYGKPMLILPFSSDQFNIAYDAERNNLAVSLNPNKLSNSSITAALEKVLRMDKDSLKKWSEFSRARGPGHAAKIIDEILKKR